MPYLFVIDRLPLRGNKAFDIVLITTKWLNIKDKKHMPYVRAIDVLPLQCNKVLDIAFITTK